jgi:hypothetical protein
MILGVLLFPHMGLYSAEVSKTGTTAATFLTIDMGSRGVGMGGAFVASVEDVTAMYWNPAGLARVPGNQAMFSHTRWLADVTLNFAGIGIQAGGAGAVGIHALFLTMDDMERTTPDKPMGTGETFSAGSYAVGLSYARNLTDRFSLGGTVKYIQERIWHSMAQGIAFDIGTIFDTQFSGLKIGMSIRNYGGKMQMGGRDMLVQTDIDNRYAGNNSNINADLNTDKWDLPLVFQVGLAVDILKGIGNSNLILAADAMHPNDDMETMNVGAEYVFNNMFSLRGGYNSLFSADSEEGLSVGAGFRYQLPGMGAIDIDYAYHDFGILNDVQMFTIRLGF